MKLMAGQQIGPVFIDDTIPDTFYVNDPESKLKNPHLKLTYLPISHLRVSYINKTNVKHKREFTDSFYTEAANDFISIEIGHLFKISNCHKDLSSYIDSIFRFKKVSYSPMKNDTSQLDSSANFIKRFAEYCDCDLVLIPKNVNLKHQIYQQNSWRNSSSSSQPIRYSVNSFVHVQLWDKAGNLLFESLVNNHTRQPRTYKIFRKRHPEKENGLINFAQHRQSPPILKSLYDAVLRNSTYLKQ